jgi:hypothetical protein
MYTTLHSSGSALLKRGLLTLFAAATFSSAQALDFGVDPYNLGKGDHIYFLSTATNKLGGNVSSVVNVPTLMNYEASQGMQYIVIKAGTGAAHFPSSGNKQVTTAVINAAHAAGLKIFAYTRSDGIDVPGEIALANYYLGLGCDGFEIDAEIEWESSHLSGGPAKAIQLCSGIKAAYPNRFLCHAPFMYISSHSSFPYKEFGYYCDAVLPQAYWREFGISPTQCFNDLETQFRNWHNGLSGQWTNSIKPIAPIAQGWNGVPSSEITTFVNALKSASNPATWKGYKSVSYWRADLHTGSMWTAIKNANILDTNPAIVSAVAAGNVSGSGALITWDTDISGDSVVNYGLTTAYGSTASSTTMLVRHAVNLSGLSPSTTYHYRVKSKNVSGQTTTSGDFTFTTLAAGQVTDIIVDNVQGAFTGSWSTGTTATDKFADDYRYKGQGTGSSFVDFTPNILTAGLYDVYEWHTQGANRGSDTPHVISYNGGTTTVNVNQQINGGAWMLLGTFNFATGTAGKVRITDAVSTAGLLAMADAIKFAYVPPLPPPNAPSGLTATPASSSQINLTWTDNSSNESGFRVEKSTDNFNFTQFISVSANITSTFSGGLTAGTTYYFRVRAYNANGNSAYSAVASATTSSGVPAAPSGLTATAVSSTQINLSWADNSGNELNFIVGRGTSSGGPYTDIAILGANVTSYSNTGLNGSTTYYYVVRSSNGSGSSANSAQASATTQPVADIIIDNPSAVVTGSWTTGTISTDKFGADYRYKSGGTGASYLTFTPNIAVAGNYQVYEWHPQGSNRTTIAPHVINFNGGSTTVTVNQQINGGAWRLVGTYNFAAGTAGNVRVTDNFVEAGLNVMADGIKFVYVP